MAQVKAVCSEQRVLTQSGFSGVSDYASLRMRIAVYSSLFVSLCVCLSVCVLL